VATLTEGNYRTGCGIQIENIVEGAEVRKQRSHSAVNW